MPSFDEIYHCTNDKYVPTDCYYHQVKEMSVGLKAALTGHKTPVSEVLQQDSYHDLHGALCEQVVKSWLQ